MEANIALVAGATLAVIAALAFKYPRGIAYPVGLIAAWFAAAVLCRGLELYRNRRKAATATKGGDANQDTRSVSTVERNPRAPGN